MSRMFFARRKAIVGGAVIIAVAAAASSAPASRAPAPPFAHPAISHGLKPAISPQSYDCTTTTSAPFYCFGAENDSAANGFSSGVYGLEGYAPNSSGGVGVLGYSGNSSVSGAYGVYGVTFATNGIGVYGAGDGPTPAPNSTPSSTQESTGVVGNSASGTGVYGSTTFPNSTDLIINPVGGVTGVDAAGNHSNVGVLGKTTGGGYGVEGTSGNDADGGVLGYATSGSGVFAESSSGFGVFATSSSGGGVYGASSSNYGVEGASTSSDAVHGSSAASAFSGVAGLNTNGGDGVFGSSTSGYGGYFSSATGSAVYGTSGGSAGGSFHATGLFSVGVDGVASFVGGDFGGSATDIGMSAEGTTVALEGETTGSGTQPTLELFNNSTLIYKVDNAGNFYTDGTMKTLARTRHGFVPSTYVTRSSAPTVDDIGGGQLINGVGSVRLDPALVEQMDMSATYRVFLTPDGDTRGLYVASKTPQGFVVRETQGGRGTLAFDYRIVAHVDGQSGRRMALSIPSPDREPSSITTHRSRESSSIRRVQGSATTHGPQMSAKMKAFLSQAQGRHASVAGFVPRPNSAIEGRIR